VTTIEVTKMPSCKCKPFQDILARIGSCIISALFRNVCTMSYSVCSVRKNILFLSRFQIYSSWSSLKSCNHFFCVTHFEMYTQFPVVKHIKLISCSIWMKNNTCLNLSKHYKFFGSKFGFIVKNVCSSFQLTRILWHFELKLYVFKSVLTPYSATEVCVLANYFCCCYLE